MSWTRGWHIKISAWNEWIAADILAQKIKCSFQDSEENLKRRCIHPHVLSLIKFTEFIEPNLSSEIQHLDYSVCIQHLVITVNSAVFHERENSASQ